MSDHRPEGEMPDGPPRTPQQRADDHFVDVLLEERFQSRGDVVTQNVDRALASLAAPPVRRRWAPVSLFATAAAAVVVMWFIIEPGAPSARAVIDRALEHALDAVDRRYELTLEDATSSSVLDLDVRGAESFCVEVLSGAMKGGKFGSDGVEMWVVPHQPIFPALRGDVPPAVLEWMERSGVDLPFLQLATVLARLGDDYDIATLDGDPDRVVAQRRGDGPGPDRVEIDVRPSDGVVRDMTMAWRGSDRRKKGSMRFRLLEETPRTPDWFDVRTHAGQRRVVEFQEHLRARERSNDTKEN